MEVWNVVKDVIWEFVLHFVGAISLLLAIPYLTLLILLTLILRPIVRLTASYFRPDLAELLPPADTIFTQLDDPNNVKNAIVVQISLIGALNPARFTQLFRDRVLDIKDETGGFRYHEFRQYAASYLGFMFWKWEDNFNLDDHLTFFTEDQPDFPQDLHLVGRKLLCGSFHENRSPWDLTIIISSLFQTSTIFFRIHHGISDGYSILYMFQRLVGDNKKHVNASPPFAQKIATFDYQMLATFPIKSIRIIGELICNSLTPFLWKIRESKKTREYVYQTGKVINVSDILRIKEKFGGTFSAIVFALLTGGIHRFLEKKNLAKSHRSRLPCMIPLPLDGHGETFENHFSFALTNLNVGEADPVKRLQNSNKEFARLRSSPLPFIGERLVQLHGSQLNFIGRLVNKFKYAPLIATYFPVGKKDWWLDGCKVADFTFVVRLAPVEAGGLFCVSSYKESLRVTPVFNKAVMNQADVTKLSGEIDEEINILLNYTDNFV